MVVKRSDLDVVSKEEAAGKLLGAPAEADTLAQSNDPRRLAIKRLLENAHVSVDDKLATLKTAHHVDKDRFQSAFRSLMGTSKSRHS